MSIPQPLSQTTRYEPRFPPVISLSGAVNDAAAAAAAEELLLRSLPRAAADEGLCRKRDTSTRLRRGGVAVLPLPCVCVCLPLCVDLGAGLCGHEYEAAVWVCSKAQLHVAAPLHTHQRNVHQPTYRLRSGPGGSLGGRLYCCCCWGEL